jgi:hypothetical protein
MNEAPGFRMASWSRWLGLLAGDSSYWISITTPMIVQTLRKIALRKVYDEKIRQHLNRADQRRPTPTSKKRWKFPCRICPVALECLVGLTTCRCLMV